MHNATLRALIFLVLFGKITAHASNYTYEKRTMDHHVIHIVTLDSKDYEPQIVKADSIKKREPVSVLAKRFGASVAINGGFFEIGGKRDGISSGTLVIKGHPYRLRDFVQSLVVIGSGGLVITRANPKKHMDPQASILSSIPLLVKEGEVVKDLFEKKSEFFLSPHARTALGIRKDGAIVIVVAEHHYIKDLNKLRMDEVRLLMKEKECEILQKYHHKNLDDITLKELKEILRNEYTSSDGVSGLSILKLAHLMKEMECDDAINLDGGSSSALWVEDKIVNLKEKPKKGAVITEKAVPNAIIFKRK